MPGILNTPRAAIAVLEREPYWAPELQRQMGDAVYIRACTRLDDVDRTLHEWPRSLVVFDLDIAPAAILSWLAQRMNPHDQPALVFASASTAELEWIVRETGAVSFRRDLVSGRDLAMQCRRLLRAG